MADAVSSVCDTHPDRFDCPDALLNYSAQTGAYGIIVHDGGSSTVAIDYCPWCGVKIGTSAIEKPREP